MKQGDQSVEEHPLQAIERPDFEDGSPTLRLVDLFCGCGGLTLGVAQAANDLGLALEIPLAVDIESPTVEVYQQNFPKSRPRVADITELLNGEVHAPTTAEEALLRSEVGEVHALVGGPPCQGHSDLNNHTRRSDPKNELYLRMVRAAEVLEPPIMVVENVPAVLHDRLEVVQRAMKSLVSLGYQVADAIVRMEQLGVPQKRKRHILIAALPGQPSPVGVLSSIIRKSASQRDLAWAIGDLAQVENPSGWNLPSRVSAENLQRMKWLLANDEYDLPNFMRPECHRQKHSYKSMYGRLRWSEPAQTITSGFGSIGQGRYMHPDLPRALTPHEAARIQGFPDYFTFEAITRRTTLANTIGNAVPPALSRAVFAPYLNSLRVNTPRSSGTIAHQLKVPDVTPQLEESA